MYATPIRPKVIIATTVAVLLLISAAVWSYAWWRALPLMETYRHGILACYPDEGDWPDQGQLVTMPDGTQRPQAVYEFAQLLLNSSNPEEQVIGITNFSPAGSELTQLQALAVNNPENPLLALHLLNACLANTEAASCETGIDSRVVANDEDNAFAWALVAQYRYLQGDDAGAYLAIRQAAEAPAYNDYFTYQLQIAASAQEAANPSYSYFGDAINYALSANLMNHTNQNYCASRISAQPEIGANCLAFFEKMAQESDTILHERIGVAWQIAIYQEQGNVVAAAILEREQAEYREAMNLRGNDGGTEALILSFYDQELADEWKQTWLDQGEYTAYETLISSAKSKSADPDYRPCQPARLRFEMPYFYVGDERVVF